MEKDLPSFYRLSISGGDNLEHLMLHTVWSVCVCVVFNVLPVEYISASEVCADCEVCVQQCVLWKAGGLNAVQM